MSHPIEHYGLIGDLEGAALVGRDGSIDWLCMPRFDSPALMAKLLGGDDNGFWSIQPQGEWRSSRRYRRDTLILETHFETDEGAVTLIDFMPVREGKETSVLVRLVRGDRGRVQLKMELAFRFDYGRTIPWVQRRDFGLTALSGPQALDMRTPVPLEGRAFRTFAEFSVGEGEVAPFVLTHRNSIAPPVPEDEEPRQLCETATRFWQDWVKNCRYEGEWREEVVRSLITLKALTHELTGGIVAAPTTSLPEAIGGERNWDYRFCWLRDATFTLYALLISGMTQEAVRWRDWLLRVAAGMPSQMQTIYGPAGERLLPEVELDWLDGYANSRPVRMGNQAYRQLQLDIYGEVLDVFHLSRRGGIGESEESWSFQRALLDFLESGWRRPDNGIWEVRGTPRHFTHSKVMVWAGFDRAVKAIELFGHSGPLDQWKALRSEIHREVCREGFNAERNSFVQFYGGDTLDASLLLIPIVGFLPPDDPRCRGTVAAIEKDLRLDGFVRRYNPDPSVEGVHGDEGAFLPCTFWLADNYAMVGETEKARSIFEGLLKVSNDLGLMAEEYDPTANRMLGNFPQAFSHVSLVNTAHNLTPPGPAVHRARQSASPLRKAQRANHLAQ